MALVTRLACILHCRDYRVAHTSHAVGAANVGDEYLAAAVGSLVLFLHPAVAKRADDGVVGVGVSAGARPAVLDVDGACANLVLAAVRKKFVDWLATSATLRTAGSNNDE